MSMCMHYKIKYLYFSEKTCPMLYIISQSDLFLLVKNSVPVNYIHKNMYLKLKYSTSLYTINYILSYKLTNFEAQLIRHMI